MANVNWQTLLFMLSLLVASATFAIQLGSTQTHVQINGDRLTIMETEHKELERSLAKLLASQIEQDRRLSTIDAHDITTREKESKILERLSKFEGNNHGNPP